MGRALPPPLPQRSQSDMAGAMHDSSAAAKSLDVPALRENLARDGYLCECPPRMHSRRISGSVAIMRASGSNMMYAFCSGPDLPQLLPRADVLAAMHRFISEVGDAVQMGTTGDADVRLGPGGADAAGPDNGIVRPVSVPVL